MYPAKLWPPDSSRGSLEQLNSSISDCSSSRPDSGRGARGAFCLLESSPVELFEDADVGARLARYASNRTSSRFSRGSLVGYSSANCRRSAGTSSGWLPANQAEPGQPQHVQEIGIAESPA
jgi:hypothetical protein